MKKNIIIGILLLTVICLSGVLVRTSRERNGWRDRAYEGLDALKEVQEEIRGSLARIPREDRFGGGL